MKTLKSVITYLSIQLIFCGYFPNLYAGKNDPHLLNESPTVPATQNATTNRTVSALVIFAAFKDQPQAELPSWTQDIFNPDVPNSLTHYYAIQSGGKHIITGEVITHWVYGDSNHNSNVSKEQFVSSVLNKADEEIDFSLYDNFNEWGEDKPDGIAEIMIFINIANSKWVSRPFLNTGYNTIYFETNDKGVKICSKKGTTQSYQPRLENQVGGMAHEYGHTLKLLDLYDLSYFHPNSTAEDYSAGIGFWGLMGEGYGIWGLYSLSEFSKMKLGWVEVHDVSSDTFDLKVKPGTVYRVQPASFSSKEYFLVSYRDHTNFYDNKLPRGLLIWHIDEHLHNNTHELHKAVDLECADGLFSDTGKPDPIAGRDNLDYFAKNKLKYLKEHNGNTFDATDPFDGKRFTEFTPYTNPNSNGYENMNAKKQTNVSHLAITNIRPGGICDIIFNYWEGILEESTIWTQDNHPYYLGRNVIVPDGKTLTINAGTIIEYNGYSIISDGGHVLRNDLISSVNETKEKTEIQINPTAPVIHQNYPNPFNSSTTINYSLPNDSYTKLMVYNLLGELVTTLVDGFRSRGTYSVKWDAHSQPSGLYIYRLETKGFSKIRKMFLQK